MKKHYIIPIFVPHEGCPHDCVFCNQGRITGEEKGIIVGPKNKLENNVDREFVVNTIRDYLETIDRKDSTLEVSFFGGTFTAININKQRELLKVAKEYKEVGLIDYIRLSTRPDYIDDFILNHLKEHKVDIIELGVQSLDDEVLRKSGRGHNSAQVEIASRLIKNYGFVLGHQIMIGLPGDTLEKDIFTVKKSLEMRPDLCRIYPALIIKDTPMEDMYLDKSYEPYSLDKAIEVCEVIYRMYREQNVNIIRVGLQPTDNIAEGKDVVAGPFHPAFRELVESKILNNDIYTYLQNYTGKAIIEIHPNRISKLYAGKKKFFKELISKVKNIHVEINMTKDMDIKYVNVITENNTYKINI